MAKRRIQESDLLRVFEQYGLNDNNPVPVAGEDMVVFKKQRLPETVSGSLKITL
jgi:hypothetical protein